MTAMSVGNEIEIGPGIILGQTASSEEAENPRMRTCHQKHDHEEGRIWPALRKASGVLAATQISTGNATGTRETATEREKTDIGTGSANETEIEADWNGRSRSDCLALQKACQGGCILTLGIKTSVALFGCFLAYLARGGV